MKNTILLLFLFFLACDSMNCIDDNDNDQNEIEWTKQASIPKDLRISAEVVTYNNEAYLMPGKGGSRFSIEPEILKYSNNIWSEIASYDGWANAGNSGAWINGDLIYLIGGLNGSGAPTDEVRSFSLNNTDFRTQNETPIPSGNRASVSSCNTDTKGYIGYGTSHNPDFQIEDNIWTYDFASGIWESIPSPSIDQAPHFSLMTSENNCVYLLFPSLAANNFYRWEEKSKEWMDLADFPGDTRTESVIVSTETHIYTGLGRTTLGDEHIYDDIWQYNIEKNEWVAFSQYPSTPFHSGFAFEMNNELFFGGGATTVIISSDSLNDEIYRVKVGN